METKRLKEYRIIFTKNYTTISAANRMVKLFERKNGIQNSLSNRKQFLVEKIGYKEYTVTLFNLRKKIGTPELVEV